MVQFVAHYETTLCDQSVNVGGVGGETHSEDNTGLDAEEAGRLLLQPEYGVSGAQLGAGTAQANPVVMKCLLHRIVNGSGVLSEAQVVVWAHVDGLDDVSRLTERPVVVVGDPVDDLDGGAGHTAYGLVPGVTDPAVDVAGVEALEALVERHVTVAVDLRSALVLLDAGLAQEVAQIAEADEDNVAEVAEQHYVKGRVFVHVPPTATGGRLMHTVAGLLLAVDPPGGQWCGR